MAQTSSQTTSYGMITYLIHHMFLPPKLPHEDDYDFKYENFMLDTTIGGLWKFKKCLPHAQSQIIESAIAMVMSMKTMNEPTGVKGGVSERGLEDALKHLPTQGKSMLISQVFF
jgi:hypothetical protein